jgi:hypothetical protein
MIKKIALLTLLLIGSISIMAQENVPATELKIEGSDILTKVEKGVKSGDKTFALTEVKFGAYLIKTTKENGKLVQIEVQEIVNDRLHLTQYIYKKQKLLMSMYSSVDMETKKTILNLRYYNKKKVCESSICRDGIDGDNKEVETTDNSEDAKRRYKESKMFKKFSKAFKVKVLKNINLLKY